MRRLALLGTLVLLSGCSGLGKFFSDTERLPGQNPNAPIGATENLQRSRGASPTEAPIMPQGGNVWPGPPQPLPSLGNVGHFEGDGLSGMSGSAMPRGGSMSMGEQDSVHHGAPLDESGFSGAGSSMSGSSMSGPLPGSVADPSTKFHSSSAPAGNGNIVIPNGDGTSTVISPDGSVKTVKGTPK